MCMVSPRVTFNHEAVDFLSNINTEVETQISYVNAEKKQQIMKWDHSSEPKKFNQIQFQK